MKEQTIAVSKFKATCLALLKKVKQTGQSIVVTRNGEPLARITPPPEPQKPDSWLGSFKESIEIRGDIMSPVLDEEDWSVLKP